MDVTPHAYTCAMSRVVADVHSTGVGRGMRIRVFDDEDRVSVLREHQQTFVPNARPDEIWTRYRRACKQVFSLRRGVLDAYSCNGSGVRTITPRLGDSLADLTHAARAIDEEAGATAVSVLGDTVLEVAQRRGLAVPSEGGERRLYTTFASLAYPLLAEALNEGGLPPSQLPLGVTRILRAHGARAGAVRAFGRGKTTRRVVKAFAMNLRGVPSKWSDAQQVLSLQTLLVATAASPALDSDRICALLAIRSKGGHPEAWDSAAVRRTVRDLLSIWRPEQALALAQSTVARPDGLLLLADTALAWHYLGRPAATAMPRPRTIGGIHQEVLSAVAPSGPSLRESVPSQVSELHGYRTKSMRLVVPDSKADLADWGRELDNCLAGYASKIARGAAWVVGVEKMGRLTYAVELDPAGGVRQFKAARNSEPDYNDMDEIAVELLARGFMKKRRPPRTTGPAGFVSLIDDAPF